MTPVYNLRRMYMHMYIYIYFAIQKYTVTIIMDLEKTYETLRFRRTFFHSFVYMAG